MHTKKNFNEKWKRNPTFRMQYEQAQKSHVLLFPEGMVTLSDSAAEVLAMFEQETTPSIAITRLCARYPNEDIESDIIEFLDVAYDKQWLQPY
ncbi:MULTISPECIES: pyrroloquinoline quinone biosynthesis peptide chaperone PqqD [Vibrio]|uniref:Coenzyme PQQ synthesis protein D n=1 Tax=Vibrio penaeicida TaxID=104609 RepID=A0AAV5NUC3_9VIBR|nr:MULTISPECIES: pyrroloquinoline quinone biosynthesis peptide chaperone PqqD [Vibrio]GLQ73607.1 coenzyme PQQ synthesis protein D [Vibrio penaeicida]